MLSGEVGEYAPQRGLEEKVWQCTDCAKSGTATLSGRDRCDPVSVITIPYPQFFATKNHQYGGLQCTMCLCQLAGHVTASWHRDLRVVRQQ